MLDTTNVIFEISEEAVPKLDDKTRAQKLDRDSGQPMWTVVLYGRGRASGRRWTAVFNVTVVSAEKPAAEEGEQVVPTDLEALPWSNERDGRVRTGVAFKASGLQVVTAASLAAA
jgi:hypothetical protein